jgi:hypothetical protein
MVDNLFELTQEQVMWFGDRLHENRAGKVIVPNHCYKKFKKIAGNEFLSNQDIKNWLIDNVYNNY